MAIVTITAIEVPQDRIDETVQAWRRYNNFLMKQPGFVSSKLHRATEPGSSFALVNVSEWKSEQEYHNAVEQMVAQLGTPTIPGVRIYPAVYETIA
ncbi:MAG: antibiotic biosynthesis monooxygenase [Dongiaceae bacterium]